MARKNTKIPEIKEEEDSSTITISENILEKMFEKVLEKKLTEIVENTLEKTFENKYLKIIENMVDAKTHYLREDLQATLLQAESSKKEKLEKDGDEFKAHQDGEEKKTSFKLGERESIVTQMDDLDDEIFSPDYDATLKEFQRERTRKRDSLVGNLLNFEPNVNENRVVVQNDGHIEIRWKRFNLDSFLIFVERLVQFENNYQTRITSIYSHIDESIQDMIRAVLQKKKGNLYEDITKMYNTSPEEIVTAVQILLAPQDIAQFNERMLKSCEKYQVEQVGSGYALTLNKLYRLKSKFKERFEFLAAGARLKNREDAVPLINSKPGGMVNTWMSLIPEKSREYYTQALANEKFTSHNEFFVKFFKKAEDTLVMSEHGIAFLTRIGESNTSRSNDRNRTIQRNDYFKDNQGYKTNYNRNYNNNYNNNNVNYNIERGRYRQKNDYHDRGYRQNAYDKFNKREHLNVMNAVEEEDYFQNSQHGQDDEEYASGAEEGEVDSLDGSVATVPVVHAIRDHRNEPREQQFKSKGKDVCYKLLVDGRCDSKSCYFSHDETLIKERREATKAKWNTNSQDLKQTPRRVTHQLNPVRTVERFKRTPEEGTKERDRFKPRPTPGRQGSGRFNMLDFDTDEDDDGGGKGSAYLTDGSDDINLIASLLVTNTSSRYWYASHKTAGLSLHNSGDYEIVSVALLDTGASNNNYISQILIDKYGLGSFTTKCNVCCRVANGTKVEIERRIKLRIKFDLLNGSAVEAQLNFYVLPGLSEEVVIGLPDIVKYFRELLLEMLEVGNAMNFISEIDNDNPDIRNPWSGDIDSGAEEEIPDPTSFQDLMFLEEEYDDARKTFLEMLPAKVEPEFSAVDGVLHYLENVAIDVFVPRDWRGIKGVEPVELELKDGMPNDLRPYRIRVPQTLQDKFEKEMMRLAKYFYKPSTSTTASPVVIAAKATFPFIRVCGDYRRVNKYIKVPKFPIPNVIESLHKISNFNVYIDLDLANAFHQIKLSEASGRLLSVVTPYGQYQPLFMPEGVSPASLILMKIMIEIFYDYLDWMIVIYDNILVLAVDYVDAFEKLKLVTTRCLERNLYLKLSKSKFGITKVDFFGYVCSNKSYTLSKERIDRVLQIPFPHDVKSMQRFLGACMYFKPFVYDYSRKTAKLNDMVHRDFNWDKDSWKCDYVNEFESFKKDILNSFVLYHPDYTLPFYLYVDASDACVGGVLIQKTAEGQQQIINFVSKKLLKSALNWSTIEKEAFSMYYSVSQLKQYLMGKHFTLLTDHRNLVWIESSEVPKIVRIRLFLQSFDFEIMHIAGKLNVFADWLSRLHPDVKGGEQPTPSIMGVSEVKLDQTQVVKSIGDKDKVRQALSSVHNSRMGHHGLRRTWLLLNEHYPGHAIPQRVISDFLSTCPQCQKYRYAMRDSLEAPIRVIEAQHRTTCGYDLVYITPPDEGGFKYLHVIRMLPSRIVGLYPSKDLTSESLAMALFQFFISYGISDVLITDPGSNVDSTVTKLLLQWFGIRLKMSLVNRHQSNGVERTHREILKFLRMLINHERVAKIWSHPHVIGIIQFIINSQISRETGRSPFEYIFGSIDMKYLQLPKIDSIETSNKFLAALNENLKSIRDAAYEVTHKIQQARLKSINNEYQVGDYVLLNTNKMGLRRDKLAPNFSGPYVVNAVYKADITIQHIVTNQVKVVHMENIKPFFCDSFEEAYQAALSDNDQHEIQQILNYKGDPETRTTMSFLVLFKDGDKVWKDYDRDLTDTVQFQTFCEERDQLKPLLHTVKVWEQMVRKMNKEPIELIKPGDIIYIDLRAWGWGYFENTGLPCNESDDLRYLVKAQVAKWDNRKHTRAEIYCKLFKQRFIWSNVDVIRYGKINELKDGMKEVDADLCERFPKILKTD